MQFSMKKCTTFARVQVGAIIVAGLSACMIDTQKMPHRDPKLDRIPVIGEGLRFTFTPDQNGMTLIDVPQSYGSKNFSGLVTPEGDPVYASRIVSLQENAAKTYSSTTWRLKPFDQSHCHKFANFYIRASDLDSMPKDCRPYHMSGFEQSKISVSRILDYLGGDYQINLYTCDELNLPLNCSESDLAAFKTLEPMDWTELTMAYPDIGMNWKATNGVFQLDIPKIPNNTQVMSIFLRAVNKGVSEYENESCPKFQLGNYDAWQGFLPKDTSMSMTPPIYQMLRSDKYHCILSDLSLSDWRTRLIKPIGELKANEIEVHVNTLLTASFNPAPKQLVLVLAGNSRMAYATYDNPSTPNISGFDPKNHGFDLSKLEQYAKQRPLTGVAIDFSETSYAKSLGNIQTTFNPPWNWLLAVIVSLAAVVVLVFFAREDLKFRATRSALGIPPEK